MFNLLPLDGKEYSDQFTIMNFFNIFKHKNVPNYLKSCLLQAFKSIDGFLR